MSQLVERAAAPTLARIRHDRERAPVQVRPLLEHLETHLFDPNLDAKRLKQACGVRDNTVSSAFHAAVNRPPYAYIEFCRMEVACELLVRTDLQVWKIAQELGYSTVQVFGRAFKRLIKISPDEFRREYRVSSDSRETVRDRIPPPEILEAEVMADPHIRQMLPRIQSGDLSAADLRHLGDCMVRALTRRRDGD